MAEPEEGTTIPMRVDLQNLMVQSAREMKATGITIGFAVATGYLRTIAKRAIELNDETLIKACEGLGIITRQ
jgi:hypothetical protein